MDDASDLLGDVGGGASASPAESAAQQGVDDAVAGGDGKNEATEAEKATVQKMLKEYEGAREFDKEARLQYSRDRLYAAGLSDPNWASDANLIGSFIDILVSFLYAQNPDPGCRPAEQVDEQPGDIPTKFAQTMELVIKNLWKNGNLKQSGKKWVRSALSVGPGWLKATMLTEKVPAPQLDQKLNTLEDQLKAIAAKREEIQEGESTESLDEQQEELTNMITGVRAQLLKKKRYGLMVDFVRAEDVTVALNISDMADYKMADWISTDIYVEKNTLQTRFPRLKDEDVKAACTYYQRNPPAKDGATDAVLGDNMSAEGQFSKTAPDGAGPVGNGTNGKMVEFAKIIEIWDRRDYVIKTIVDGVKFWAVEPYAPPQASTRFYPHFYLAFFPVDGKRHPQSLSWRLRKLQDEYNSCRSNQRLVRERSVTGVIFNKAAIDPDDATAITNANQQEMVGVRTVADEPLQNLFIAKPVGTYNPQLYETNPIREDMQTVSGVSEALQQTAESQQPKTATEANIEHTGFLSRTSADRDTLEDALTDLAQYTAEVGSQECSVSWVQRVCGKNAFWLGPNDTVQPPQPGMDVEDVLTMAEITIDAGSTGKPNSAADKANWATLLPLLEQSLLKIRAAQGSDPNMAQVLIRVLQETLKRLDDRLELDEFIPQGQPTPPPPPPPEAPKTTISIALTGQLPPGDAQAVMAAEGQIVAEHMPPGPGGPGGPPPGAPVPPGLAPHLPTTVPGTQIPMPPLHVKTPAPKGPPAPPSK